MATIHSTDSLPRVLLCLALWSTMLLGTGCASESDHAGAGSEHHGDEHSHAEDHGHDEEHGHDDEHGHGEGESWSVTAWGGLYEIFPEVDALVAGESASAHTHVTVLQGFAPLVEGRVDLILTGEGGREQVSSSTQPVRPGIFNVELTAESPGEYDLSFRIASAAGEETIRGGRVRVGDEESPGGILRAPAPRGATSGSEPISFLKEPQWQGAFATDWVRKGTLGRSLEGLAVARPAAGGDAWITAPVDGLVEPRPWPFVGRKVETGDLLFRLAPTVSAERSLAELDADARAAGEEQTAAEARLSRLEELLAVEATSPREVAEARARVGVAQARLAATKADLEAARAARQGRGGGESLQLKAPFAGKVASVEATPGSAAGAGERLARLVRTDIVWLAVAVPPRAAVELVEGVSGIVLEDSLRFDAGETRLISVAPSVDPATGKLDVLVEIAGAGVPIGSSWNAQILLADGEDGNGGSEGDGLVIPTSALVDDGGADVVYLQLSGESFVRQPVRIVARQGDRVLVDGLVAGQRLVTRGGESIRRATLMATGAGHGHIH